MSDNPIYNVMVECEDNCHAWEPDARVAHVTHDPIEAIHRSSTHRDKAHRSWVEKATSQELQAL